jgi:hypothetical protein
MKKLSGAGMRSLNGIADALNARRVLTPAGSDHWYASHGLVESVGIWGPFHLHPRVLRLVSEFQWSR